jgi:pimeloyl-ACP methyl ester carboxylesterase
MSFFADLRDSGRLSQILSAAAAVLIFALLGLLTIAGLLLYDVMTPPSAGGSVDPNVLMGRPTVMSFSVPGGSAEGWFFPGFRTAPTIIVCHGYGSSREDVLTIVTALQEHKYNVFLFDFSGHGRSKRFSTLGFRETREVLAAVRVVAERPDVDKTRFGVWGSTLGGYAALSAAAQDRRIRALIVDSVYDRPLDFFNLQIQSSPMQSVPLAGFLSRMGFKLFTFTYRKDPTLSLQVTKLAGVPKLFLQANDNPLLADSTLQLFLKAPEPREQLIVQKSRYSEMIDDEKRAYENQLVRFFLVNLPVTALPAPAAPAR